MSTFFVGNLSWDTTSESLMDYLSEEFGIASAEVQRRQDSDRSKGWALVTLAKAEDAEDFVKTFNESELDGRTIVVRADRGATRSSDRPPRQQRQQRQQRNYDDNYEQQQDEVPPPSLKLFVGNLSWDTTSEQLDNAFADCGGKVVSAEVMLKPDGRSRGWGVVEFATVEDAEIGLKLDGTVIDEREIKVEFQKARRTRTNKRRTRAPRKQREFDESQAGKSVYIGNLPWTVNNDELCELFEGFNVQDGEVMTGYDGRSRGYGIVTFGSEDEAADAIAQYDGTELGGRNIVARLDRGPVVRE